MSGSEAAGGRQAAVGDAAAVLRSELDRLRCYCSAMEKCLAGGRMSKPWDGSGKEAAASRSASVAACCCHVPLGMEDGGALGQSDCGSWLDFTKGGGKRSTESG